MSLCLENFPDIIENDNNFITELDDQTIYILDSSDIIMMVKVDIENYKKLIEIKKKLIQIIKLV
jgi:hypothetical protein